MNLLSINACLSSQAYMSCFMIFFLGSSWWRILSWLNIVWRLEPCEWITLLNENWEILLSKLIGSWFCFFFFFSHLLLQIWIWFAHGLFLLVWPHGFLWLIVKGAVDSLIMLLFIYFIPFYRGYISFELSI